MSIDMAQPSLSAADPSLSAADPCAYALMRQTLQGLNLVQVLFLHSLRVFPPLQPTMVMPPSSIPQPDLVRRVGALAAVWGALPLLQLSPHLSLALLATSPWLFRSRFPVNPFSANYKDLPSATLIGVLYRLKKYQV